MNSRMRKHAALAVVTLAAAGALTLAACAETPAASSDAPAIQNQSKSEESMTNERNGGYATISEDEAVAMMSENSATLVDVRTAREYADGHIPGAINIPVETIGSVKPAGLQGVDENASIIVLTVVICVLTSILTLFLQNSTVAALLSPIIISMALAMGISPIPWCVIAAIGTNLAIATPIGTAVNMQILPAGYTFKDFALIGGPLFIIMVAAVSVLGCVIYF